jgi:hypothetical protein
VLWLLFSEPFMSFMNALFHGVDFRPLYSGGAFDAGSWLGAVVVLSAWGFLLGALFAVLMNWLRVERPLA